NKCVNRLCGPDGCKIALAGTQESPVYAQGTCGFAGCAAGFVCDDALGRCKDAFCPSDANDPGWATFAFDCQGRQCGLDAGNCGYECGVCAQGKACNRESNQCVPVKACDSNAPECKSHRQGQGPAEYCGFDCEWHKTYEPLVDLIPSAEG